MAPTWAVLVLILSKTCVFRLLIIFLWRSLRQSSKSEVWAHVCLVLGRAEYLGFEEPEMVFEVCNKDDKCEPCEGPAFESAAELSAWSEDFTCGSDNLGVIGTEFRITTRKGTPRICALQIYGIGR